MKAPFPWFGGKSRVADLVWPRFGDCPNYLEPFAGSLAMLLGRPHWSAEKRGWLDNSRSHVECANDLDGAVVNFWRAIRHDPEETAEWADNPVFELDLHARHQWLHRRLLATDGLSAAVQAKALQRGILPFAAWLEESPDNHDCQVAGWWAWGLSSWIGDNWARPYHLAARPQLRGSGQGVNRKLPHLSDAGQGACAHHLAALVEWFQLLADRFRNVDICCGDWERILGFSPTEKRAAPCAVFLDPPYSQDHGLETVYGSYHDPGVAAHARAWCIERGGSKDMRIALCGYDTEHGELEAHGWQVLAWKSDGGYGNQGDHSRGRENAYRERIWFSPACLELEPSLFEDSGIAAGGCAP